MKNKEKKNGFWGVMLKVILFPFKWLFKALYFLGKWIVKIIFLFFKYLLIILLFPFKCIGKFFVWLGKGIAKTWKRFCAFIKRKEGRAILGHRIMAIISFLLCCAPFATAFIWIKTIPLLSATFILFPIGVLLLIRGFSFKYRVYNIDGKEILVYAGAKNHYVKVNGKIVDEYVCVSLTSEYSISFKVILEKHTVETLISFDNHITTHCDGKLLK